MISKLEDALLRCRNDTGNFREMLFSYLDDGVSLLRLRCTSRVLENIVGHLPLDRLFRHVYIRTPLPEPDEIAFLVEIAPHVRSLTIVVGSPDLSQARAPRRPSSQVSRRSQEFVQSLLLRLNQLGQSEGQMHGGGRNSMPSLRRSLVSMLSNPNSPRASVPPTILTYAERQQQYEERQLWSHIISHFARLSSLTLRVHGDAGWPGLTEIEQTLINIRCAIEQRSFSTELRTFNLIPVHAMGIIHLLWTPLHAFGESSAAAANLWQRIETLDLRIHSPINLTASQQIMFKQLLYQYLDSFAPSLRRLRLIWLGSEGPSPLALHLGPGLVEEKRPPIIWDNLEELWLGNITQPHQTIRLIPELTPNVRLAKTLRSTRRDSVTVDASDSSAWVEVLLAQTSPSRTMMDRSSSLYSRESARVSVPWPTGISRSSREVEFILDVKNM